MANRAGTAPRSASRGRRIIFSVLAGAAILSIGGWIGAQFVTTPAQQAAKAAPPVASLVTMPVESRVVSDDIVTRGDVVSAQTTNVLADRAVADTTAVVVTALPYGVGSDVSAGTVVVQLSGRPVIALLGAFSAYRDVDVGAVGPDVAQLQTALKAAGYATAARDKAGTFAAGTAAAVQAMYKKLGYPAQTAIPASEILYVPSFPARVESGSARVGSAAADATLNVATGNLTVSVTVDDQILAAVRAGAKVELSSEVLGVTATGSVPVIPSSEVDTSATQDSAGSGNPVSDADTGGGTTDTNDAPTAGKLTIVPDAPLPSTWDSQNVRVTFVNASSDGKVIAVPVTAISAGADGGTHVVVITKKAGRSVRTRVDVKVGVMGGGYAAITPLNARLVVGDDVLVGIS